MIYVQESIKSEKFIEYKGIKIHESLLNNDDVSQGLDYNENTEVVYIDEYKPSGSTWMEHFDNMHDALAHAALEIKRIGLENDNHYILPTRL